MAPSSPSTELLSATVTGPEFGTADALTTAILPSDGTCVGALWRFPGYEALMVDRDLRVCRTRGITFAVA